MYLRNFNISVNEIKNIATSKLFKVGNKAKEDWNFISIREVKIISAVTLSALVSFTSIRFYGDTNE